MDSVKDYENKISQYNITLANAKKACDKADKDLIISETQLKQQEDRRIELEKQCQDVAGVSIEKLDAVIDANVEELDELISFINSKFSASNNASQSDIDDIENFMNNRGLPVVDNDIEFEF